MSRKKTTEGLIKELTKKYSTIRFIDSDTKGLYYAVAPDDDRLAILCGGGYAILSLEQLYTVTKEAIKVWELNVDDECKRNVPRVRNLR